MNLNVYKEAIEKSYCAYAYHKIILDDNGLPCDYVFLEVNKAFELHTGLKKENVINKKFIEDISGENDPEFDWVKTYGDVAITGKYKEFNQFSTILNRYYSIKVFSPEKYYFVTIFQDRTLEKRIQEISKYFLENIGTNIDYYKITELVLELTGAKYAVFNKFEDNGKNFQQRL